MLAHNVFERIRADALAVPQQAAVLMKLQLSTSMPIWLFTMVTLVSRRKFDDVHLFPPLLRSVLSSLSLSCRAGTLFAGQLVCPSSTSSRSGPFQSSIVQMLYTKLPQRLAFKSSRSF